MSGHPDSLWVRLARKEWTELEIGYVFNQKLQGSELGEHRSRQVSGLQHQRQISQALGSEACLEGRERLRPELHITYEDPRYQAQCSHCRAT